MQSTAFALGTGSVECGHLRFGQRCADVRGGGSEMDPAEAEQSPVGDGDTVGVAGQVLQHLSGPPKVDVAVLEGHGIGRVAHANDDDGLVFLRDIVWRVINNSDNNVGIAAVHAPEPVVVVSTEGGWKVEMIAAVEEVDGAGLTVVAGEDADAVLVCRWKGVEGAGDDCDLLLPTEAVGVELRELTAGEAGFRSCCSSGAARWCNQPRWRGEVWARTSAG